MTRQNLLMVLIMTLLMGLILSGVFTWQAQGVSSGFVSAWTTRFVGTYIVVLPTVLVVAPLAQRLALTLDRKFGGQQSPEEVALSAWQANATGHAGGGFDSWLAALAEDVSVWMPLGAFRGENRGKAKAAQICEAIASASPNLTYEKPLRVTSKSQTVVIEFEDHGTIAGFPYRNRIAASFDIKDGKVAQYREYFGDIDPAIVAMMSDHAPQPVSEKER
jgi:ketosteroid isomerase-like protein